VPALLPLGNPVPQAARTSVAVTQDLVAQHTRHVFEGRFTPLRLVVNGRKGRRVVVVLGSDRKHYRVLDLDFKKGDEEDEASEGEEEGDVEMGGA
jgi:anaphase-promoting complex subunit 4